MSEHKHASVLRAIADGASIDEFEIEWIHGNKEYAGFKNATFRDLIYAIQFPEHWKVRRKPQRIIVNGFKVPKPLDVMPPNGDVYGVATSRTTFYEVGNAQYEWSRTMIARGILHSTPEAAIAHAKAMLGIDPKWEE